MKFNLIILINLIFLLPTLAAEAQYDNKVKVVSSYCTQNNSTQLYFDRSLIGKLTNKQYLLENFESNIPNEGARLDYFIKYFHIAKGFCYYNTEDEVKKSLEEFRGINTIVDDKQKDEIMKYSKTVNCYYMYKQYLLDIPENYVERQMGDGSVVKEFNIKRPCYRHCVTFYNIMLYFLNNPTLCPYPQDKRMISLGDEDAIKEARNQYIYELQAMCTNEINNENCYDDLNEEIINCGYSNKRDRTEYCRQMNDECCAYRSQIENIKLIDYKPKTSAIIIGLSTSVAFLILGLFFSYDAIKDIKTKERIEEAVYRQEKMYSNKQQSRRNSGYSSDNQNSLHPPSLHSYSLPKNQNPENRPIRSPQPLPVSPANYSNYNSNASLLGNSSNVGGSSNSVNLRPRVSSLYSQSSADISSDISVPIEVPVSPYIDRPNAERRSSSVVDQKTDRPSSIIERPPRSTPVLDCPQSPNLISSNSPYLQPYNYSPSRPGTPSTPNRLTSMNSGSRPSTPIQGPTSPNLRPSSRPTSPNLHPSSRPATPQTPHLDRPPRTPELERPSTPKLELPPSSPYFYL